MKKIILTLLFLVMLLIPNTGSEIFAQGKEREFDWEKLGIKWGMNYNEVKIKLPLLRDFFDTLMATNIYYEGHLMVVRLYFNNHRQPMKKSLCSISYVSINNSYSDDDYIKQYFALKNTLKKKYGTTRFELEALGYRDRKREWPELLKQKKIKFNSLWTLKNKRISLSLETAYYGLLLNFSNPE